MAKRKRTGDPDEDVVTMSTLRELLDNQKKELTGLMEVQERNFRSFVETVMVTTNRRLDDLIREVQDVKGSLQYSRGEIEGAGTPWKEEQEQRIARVEKQITDLRADVDHDIMVLDVRGLKENTSMRMYKDATVDQLYRKVCQWSKIPLCRLRLVHTTCKQLEYGAGKYLSDYDVKHESTLYVTLRVQG